jgi:two-component system, NarL family, response regulator DevR
MRVFLVDDHPMIREEMARALDREAGFEVVGQATSAASARRRIPLADPDVVVQDVRLPDGNGIDVCREIRSVCPDIKFLMLSGYDDEDDVLRAMTAGASGFLLKEGRAADVVAAIRAIGQGSSLLGSSVARRVLERLRPEGLCHAMD